VRKLIQLQIMRNFLALAMACALTGCSLLPSNPLAGDDKGGGKGGGKGGKKGDAAVPVTLTKVTQRDVPIEIQVIGNVEAFATVTVKSQVGGELVKVFFNEGDFVKQGDPLFTIDQRQLQAQIAQAEAAYMRAKATLGQAEATLAKDTANLKYLRSQSSRIDQLVKEGVMSKDQGEQSQSGADAIAQLVNADKASIESAKADINAARAAADNLKVQLTYTDIRATLTGRTGNLMVKQGNLVAANGVDMVAINQVQPIYVTFAIPENQLGAVRKYMALGKLQVVATPQDDASESDTGVLTFIDNTVDASTGTIKLKGTFQNAHRRLWPGQFVRVVLRLYTQKNANVVPNQAVQTGQEGPYVFVVKQDQTVESRPVVTGARINEEMVIDKGLELGETVVTDGQLRLAPGMKVQQRGDGQRGGKKKSA
jgi:multidrug efflux system membrane fusion protein